MWLRSTVQAPVEWVGWATRAPGAGLVLTDRLYVAGNSSPVDARLHAQNLKAFKDACDILKRDAVGAQLPTPLKVR